VPKGCASAPSNGWRRIAVGWGGEQQGAGFHRFRAPISVEVWPPQHSLKRRMMLANSRLGAHQRGPLNLEQGGKALLVRRCIALDRTVA